MEKYRDIGGNSGISAYEIGDDFIIVCFAKGGVYLYDYFTTGSYHVNNMVRLARMGNGLNGYINLNAKYTYARKIA
ncbi:hypothetical protein GCM10016272_05710 [Psychrobacter glaciei]|uniref:KTSC domain-containing protein n=1 Tax=Psychrobacter glaciei TaxID=619771 RepID=A0ABQ3GPB3_9GAMM|nr:hypothetical protein [Psychrobacter glaciei]GHD27469.1 hypothetical protein GCM10016272_05710 [Psychrobacter glaciei]